MWRHHTRYRAAARANIKWSPIGDALWVYPYMDYGRAQPFKPMTENEPNQTSNKSAQDEEQADQPILDLMNKVNAHKQGEQASKSAGAGSPSSSMKPASPVSDNVYTAPPPTADGARGQSPYAPPPPISTPGAQDKPVRTSFLQGLQAIFGGEKSQPSNTPQQPAQTRQQAPMERAVTEQDVLDAAKAPASNQPTPSRSFMEGLQRIFESTSDPEQQSKLQAEFSIAYILRKTKEAIGSAMGAVLPKPQEPYGQQGLHQQGHHTQGQQGLHQQGHYTHGQQGHHPQGQQQTQSQQLRQHAGAIQPGSIQSGRGASGSSAPPTFTTTPARAALPSPQLRGLQEIISPRIRTSVFQSQQHHPYTGEQILARSHIDTGTYRSGASEPLVSIAGKHLSRFSGASKAMLDAYATEIATINGLDREAANAPDNADLVLPGHTSDGGLVLTDGVVTMTKYQDGRKTIRSLVTGRQYVEIHTADGGVQQEHSGPGFTDTFIAIPSRDGTHDFYAKDGTHYQPGKSLRIADAHAKLEFFIRQRIKDPVDSVKFEADMVRFEDRCTKRRLPESEVIQTFEQIKRLIDSKSDYLSDKDRLRLAQEILSQAAEPRSICQGIFKTCQVSAIEAMIYTTEPSKAAKVIADIALMGEFAPTGYMPVKFDNLRAHNLTPPHFDLLDGTSSFATQILHAAAVNAIYANNGSGKQYFIDQRDRKDARDRGERLCDKDGHELARHHALDDNDTVTAYRMLAGRNEGGRWDSIRTLSDADIVQGLNRDGCVMICHKESSAGVAGNVDKVADERELIKLLTALKEAGRLPVAIWVHTAHEPFFSDARGEQAGAVGGPHVVTITEFVTGPPPVVAIDNHWLSSGDRRTTNVMLHDLYVSMREPKDTICDLQAEVEVNRANNTIDTSKELDLVRLKYRAKQMDDTSYGCETARVMQEAQQRWTAAQQAGKRVKGDMEGARVKLELMRRTWTSETARAFEGGGIGNAGTGGTALGSRVGAVKQFFVPPSWKLTRHEETAYGYVYTWRPEGGCSDISLNLAWSGKKIPSPDREQLQAILQLPPHKITEAELPAMYRLLVDKCNPELFELISARTEDICGRQVFRVTGRFKNPEVYDDTIYVNSTGDCEVFQEVSYLADTNHGGSYTQDAEKAFQSLQLD